MKLPTDRVFGFTFAGLFAVIATVGWFFFDHLLVWALAVSAAFAIVAVVKPGILMPLNRLWGKIAPKIALVTNGIVLGLAFCLVIVPVGIIMRLMGRDPMHRTIGPGHSSYWSPVKHRDDRDSYRDLF